MAERRLNPLTGEWVLVSAGRAQRPWQGAQASASAVRGTKWRSDCYLCARNTRANGAVNPDYQGTFAFDNDFPALDDAVSPPHSEPLLQAETVRGHCRVLCYSSRHDATLATLNVAELRDVVALWCAEHAALAQRYSWVQIFENKGELMGCSSPHPHGQIWATSTLPTIAALEEAHQRAYAARGENLLVDYVERELALGQRVVASTERWVALVPFWAVWPFETMLLPVRHRSSFDDLDAADLAELAQILAKLLPAYDRLFDVSFPYSMGWHGRGLAQGAHWQLHAHFYPPLLRSAEIRKFMVGYEMLAEAQRDILPEEAAARLRHCVNH